MSMLRYYSREPGACRELCRREGLRAISDAMRYHFSENTILEVSTGHYHRLTVAHTGHVVAMLLLLS